MPGSHSRELFSARILTKRAWRSVIKPLFEERREMIEGSNAVARELSERNKRLAAAGPTARAK